MEEQFMYEVDIVDEEEAYESIAELLHLLKQPLDEKGQEDVLHELAYLQSFVMESEENVQQFFPHLLQLFALATGDVAYQLARWLEVLMPKEQLVYALTLQAGQAVANRYIDIVAPTFDAAVEAELRATLQTNEQFERLIDYYERTGHHEEAYNSAKLALLTVTDQRHPFYFVVLLHDVARYEEERVQQWFAQLEDEVATMKQVAKVVPHLFDEHPKVIVDFYTKMYPLFTEAHLLTLAYDAIEFLVSDQKWRRLQPMLAQHFQAVAPLEYTLFQLDKGDDQLFVEWVQSDSFSLMYDFDRALDTMPDRAKRHYLAAKAERYLQMGEREMATRYVDQLRDLCDDQMWQKYPHLMV